MTFRFVHCADVHFDRPFVTASPGARQQLAAAARETFTDLVALCLKEKVHALLVAGDLFDAERLGPRTEEFLLAELRRLTAAGVTVVAASGNADPGGPNGRAKLMDWPRERFHLCADHDPVEVVVHDRDGEPVGRVVGAGLIGAHDAENLLPRFEVPAGPEPAVALLHAAVAEALGAHEHDKVAPCRADELAERGFRYWALGHVHRRQAVLDRPAAHYPGALLGHSFDECGPAGALLVTLPPAAMPRVEFKPLARVRWESIVLDELQTVGDPAELAGVAADAWAERRKAAGPRANQRWMLRVVLRGECPAAGALRDAEAVDELASELAGADDDLVAVEVRTECLTRPVDLEEHRGQPHLLGLSLDIVEEAGADPELLANLTPDALAGCPSGQPAERLAYLRDLLQDTGRLAAGALLRETDR